MEKTEHTSRGNLFNKYLCMLEDVQIGAQDNFMVYGVAITDYQLRPQTSHVVSVT